MTTQTQTRSRIDGALHRSLPATIALRAAESGQADDGLLRLRLSVSSETPYLRNSGWEEPWIEVLGHADGEINLDRLNGGAVVLANHDRYTAVGNTPLAGIGAVERAWIEGKRLWCDIVISRREALKDFRQDVADGLVKNVSLGYTIEELVLVRAGANGEPAVYRVIRWTPFEVSPVDVPADPNVGLGRSADASQAGSTPSFRVVSLSPAVGTNLETRKMEDEILAPAEQTRAAAPAQPRSGQPDCIALERERVRELTALGKSAHMTEQAERAIDSGMSLDQFRKQVIDSRVADGTLRPAESAEIGMSKRDIEQFSFARAMLAAADPAAARQLAPFEYEASQAAQDKRGSSRAAGREAAITIPMDVLSRGMQLNQMSASLVASRLMQSASNGAAVYRDLLVGTGSAGGNTVATQLLGSSFIDLLRNALVLDRMGVTMLGDLNGNLAIPSATGTAQHYWLAENGAPTESQASFGQVALTPKTIGAFTDYSRRLLLQSSIDVEAFVRADLAAVIAQGILLAAINGSGTGSEPTGLLNTSGIGAVAGGTNGAAPTYDNLVDLESAVAISNADVGNLAYLTNSKARGKLRKTQQFTGTNGVPVWGKGRESGLGDVMGYDAYVTNAVPSNLTKGTANGICSAIAFGNWADMLIGMWGGLDMMIDPYTMSTSGAKRVVALQDLDIQLRRLASFAAMKDALTT